MFGKEGRKITARGREELKHSLVPDQVGFVISRIEALSYLTTLDLATMEGNIILNISYFPAKKLQAALKLLKPVFRSPYVMSDRVLLAREGRGDRECGGSEGYDRAGHSMQRHDQRDIPESRHSHLFTLRRDRRRPRTAMPGVFSP